MKTTSIRARALTHALQSGTLKGTLCALLAGTALCGLTAGPAAAQSAREHRALDSNGVDLTHGDFVLAFAEGSIGSGGAELGLVRSRIGSGNGSRHTSSGPHQWDGIHLIRTVGAGGATSVVLEPRFERFATPGTLPTGSSLTAVGAEHHYRTADGTLIVFGDPSGSTSSGSTYCNGSSGQGNCTQLPLSIASPDGKTVEIDWEIFESCTNPDLIDENNPPVCSHWARIGSVSNSFGYRIAFAYASNGNSGTNQAPPPDSWQRRTSAALYNDQVSTSVAQASVAYSYPAANVVEVTDMGGRQWRFAGNGTSVTAIRRPGATSDTTTIAYGGPGGTVSSVTRDGVTTNYSRSVSGTAPNQIATMTVTQVDPNGPDPVSTIVSDLTIGRPTAVTDPLGHTTAFTYDSGRPKRVTAPEGNYVEHSYDPRGNVTQTVAVPKPGSTLSPITVSASFDQGCPNPVTCNQPNSTTDERGNVTHYSYDPNHGGILTATGPAVGGLRPQTRYAYADVAGEIRLTSVRACQTQQAALNGNPAACAGGADETVTGYEHDNQGNVLKITQTDGLGTASLTAATVMTYDARGDLLTADGPLAGAADTGRIRYNSARQVVGTVSPDPDGGGPLKPRAVRNSYTNGLLTKVERGNVNSQSDSDWAGFAAAEAVETEYDSNARPAITRLVSGSTIHALSQTGYDSLGRVDCVAQRMNRAIFAGFTLSNPNLPLACGLAEQGNGAEDFGPDRIAKSIYDAASQVVQVRTAVGTSLDAAESTMSYRPNGQVELVVDGKGNKTQYAYDGHDRLSTVTYPSATAPAAFNDSTPATALATAGAVNAGDYEEIVYGNAGGTGNSTLVASFRNRGGDTIGFGYDAFGRMTSKDRPNAEPDVSYGYDLLGRMTSASQSGHSLGFGYDALGRLRTESGPLGTMASEYDLAGRRTKLTWPDTFYVTYDHLVTGEVTKIRENGAASGIGVLASFDHDQLGRRTALTRGNGVVTSYGHDAASRLESMTQDMPSTANDVTLGFAYNPASQIVSTTRSNDLYAWNGHSNGTTSTTANGRNQIASWVNTLVHDSKGNVIQDGTYNYAYSSENLLTSLTNSATGAIQSASTYSYDPLMRLAKIDSSNSALDADLAYDGQEIVLEGLSEGRRRRYVFGPGVDEPLVGYLVTGAGASRSWYLADERGSIVRQTDDSGTPGGGIGRYDEYGIGPGTSRFQYTGQYWLGDSNLHYYRARVYDPKLGRFLQPDPIGYQGGINLYAYVKGDPVNFTDPSGLTTCRAYRERGSVTSTSETSGVVQAGKLVQRCWSDGSGTSGDGRGRGQPGGAGPGTRSFTDAEKKLFMCHGFDPAMLDRIRLHDEMTSVIAELVYMASNNGAVTLYSDIYYRRGAPVPNSVLYPGGIEALRVLAEEMGHALQYRQGMTIASYLKEYVNSGFSYENMSYEKIAQEFANHVVREFISGKCTGRYATPAN